MDRYHAFVPQPILRPLRTAASSSLIKVFPQCGGNAPHVGTGPSPTGCKKKPVHEETGTELLPGRTGRKARARPGSERHGGRKEPRVRRGQDKGHFLNAAEIRQSFPGNPSDVLPQLEFLAPPFTNYSPEATYFEAEQESKLTLVHLYVNTLIVRILPAEFCL